MLGSDLALATSWLFGLALVWPEPQFPDLPNCKRGIISSIDLIEALKGVTQGINAQNRTWHIEGIKLILGLLHSF